MLVGGVPPDDSVRVFGDADGEMTVLELLRKVGRASMENGVDGVNV